MGYALLHGPVLWTRATPLLADVVTLLMLGRMLERDAPGPDDRHRAPAAVFALFFAVWPSPSAGSRRWPRQVCHAPTVDGRCRPRPACSCSRRGPWVIRSTSHGTERVLRFRAGRRVPPRLRLPRREGHARTRRHDRLPRPAGGRGRSGSGLAGGGATAHAGTGPVHGHRGGRASGLDRHRERRAGHGRGLRRTRSSLPFRRGARFTGRPYEVATRIDEAPRDRLLVVLRRVRS